MTTVTRTVTDKHGRIIDVDRKTGEGAVTSMKFTIDTGFWPSTYTIKIEIDERG